MSKIINQLRKYHLKCLASKPVSRWPLRDRMIRAMKGYKQKEGHSFDLFHPVLFTEKIVWYKLFYIHPDMTRLYDKYLLKSYLEEKIGPGHTAPLYGVWTDVKALERDWDDLPNAFCLKSNCSSLGKNLKLIRDKRSVDKKALFEEAARWLNPMNTGHNSCNRAYYGVKPRILAEKLLEPSQGNQLYDYKILCFHGQPDHVMATADRFPLGQGALSYSFYDFSWRKLPVTTPGYGNADIPRPHGLDKMISLAEKLSQGFPFIRIDFYDTTDGVYVGEMTLYPSPNYDQKKWDRALGDKFILPQRTLTKNLEILRGIKRWLWQLVQKPISQWPEEKRVARAMQGFKDQRGYTFDLNHPVLFTEKRIWYLLFYDHPDLTRLYDKYLFKGYIEEKLGPGYTVPLYGMWTNIHDLKRDWDRLPEAFCLKSNCSSRGENLMLIRHKSTVEKKTLFREVKKWLNPLNIGINSCNRAYHGVKPRIIAEKLLEGIDGQFYDYKVMCFSGKPDHFLGTVDRFPLENDDLSKAFYDLSWNKLPITACGHENRDIPRPAHLEQMLEIARKLSAGFPHIRVDFYDTADGVYIGEMTLYSTTVYDQREWDLRLGNLFVLPGIADDGNTRDGVQPEK